MAFRDSTLLTECIHKNIILLPKGNGEFRVIGIIEVIWNTASGMINLHIWAKIIYHDVLHSLWAGRGMGTDSLKIKLLQQLMEMREEVLYKVSLDLCKACDALNWQQCLNIIIVYILGQ